MCDETSPVFFEMAVYCHETAKAYGLELVINTNHPIHPTYNVKGKDSAGGSGWLIQTYSINSLKSFLQGFSAAKEENKEKE